MPRTCILYDIRTLVVGGNRPLLLGLFVEFLPLTVVRFPYLVVVELLEIQTCFAVVVRVLSTLSFQIRDNGVGILRLLRRIGFGLFLHML